MAAQSRASTVTSACVWNTASRKAAIRVCMCACPRDGNHHGAGAGIEVQILDDAASRYRDLQPYQFSASLYAVAPAARGSARPPGTWNSLDICCVGHHYTITHNGQLVLDVSRAGLSRAGRASHGGFLGLQNHSEAVWFRHLRIGPSLMRPVFTTTTSVEQ